MFGSILTLLLAKVDEKWTELKLIFDLELTWIAQCHLLLGDKLFNRNHGGG